MTKLIIANWKSNKNKADTKNFLEEFNKHLSLNPSPSQEREVIFAPPSNLLYLFEGQENINLAVQDISSYPNGSYTGAISAKNLEDFNIKYAIVGHSERRRYFHETHQDVANKVAQCIENGITPIVCVDDEYISLQAAAIEGKYLNKCMVAYEELGAIGSGKNEPVDHVAEVMKKIEQSFGKARKIYGGSVDEDNIESYLAICDGVLVGTASLKVESFVGLLV